MELVVNHSLSKYATLWHNSVFKVVVSSLKEKLNNPEEPLTRWKRIKLEWRISLYLYYLGEYYEALEYLEFVCRCRAKSDPAGSGPVPGDGEDEIRPHPNTSIHVIAGRCCMQLFLNNRSHFHLENAHQHYQIAVETLKLDLSAMFRLPAILLEYGRVLEHYGAFSAAMDAYKKILSNFPNYR